ncbi:hypothetical protein SBV1_2500008 [Verrucomicrobia bacterium]|nr:hypothetical protein SBV1_2500008 [Verrucomicrobiota bacterium]
MSTSFRSYCGIRGVHYNVKGRQLFWSAVAERQSAAATPLWAERSDGAFSNGRSLSNGLYIQLSRASTDRCDGCKRLCKAGRDGVFYPQ